MIPLEKRLGNRIAERRRLAKVTQAELAERVNCTTETISRMERGRTLPSLTSLERIARALGCELHDFLYEDRAAQDGALERLVAYLASRNQDDIHLVYDLAARIFQHISQMAQRPSPRSRRR